MTVYINTSVTRFHIILKKSKKKDKKSCKEKERKGKLPDTVYQYTERVLTVFLAFKLKQCLAVTAINNY